MTTLPTPGKDLRIVTSRCSSCCPGASARLGKLVRQPVELGVGVCDLAVHELEPLGHRLEMGCGRAHGPGCDRDRCCAQAFEHLGRGEAPDAMALQQSSDCVLHGSSWPSPVLARASRVPGTRARRRRRPAPASADSSATTALGRDCRADCARGVRSSPMRDHSRSSTMTGSSGSRRRRQRGSVRSASASTARRGCRPWRRRARSGRGIGRAAWD